ncbi:hypothetical protein WJX82_009650 [Trebouxia sp. C0006]
MDICYIRPPALVFQCSGCRSILSDSDLFLCSVEALNILVVKGGSGIQVDPISQACSLLSHANHDSAYMAVTCTCCGSAVGRLYTATPPVLEGITQSISLDIATISSYKLGHSEVHTAGASDTPLLEHGCPALVQAAEQGSSDRQDNDNASHLPDQQLVHRLQRLESDMTKVQNMLLLHSERLDHVGTDQGGCQQPLMVTPSRQPAG